jgi:Domain of unknown function (DUF4124)
MRREHGARHTSIRGYRTTSRLGSLPVMKIVALTLVVVCGAAQAQYKCITPTGAITYQQAACPITQKQKTLNDRTASPAVAASAVAPSPGASSPNSPTTQRDRRSKDSEQTVAAIEADFERLRAVRADLEAMRKLASR